MEPTGLPLHLMRQDDETLRPSTAHHIRASGPARVFGAVTAGSGGQDDGRHTGASRASELNVSAFGLITELSIEKNIGTNQNSVSHLILLIQPISHIFALDRPQFAEYGNWKTQ